MKKSLAFSTVALLAACAGAYGPLLDEIPVGAMPLSRDTPVERVLGTWRGRLTITPTGRCTFSGTSRPTIMTISSDGHRRFLARFIKADRSVRGTIESDFTVSGVEIGDAQCGDAAQQKDIRRFNGRFVETPQGLMLELETDLLGCQHLGCTFHERGIFTQLAPK